MSIYFQILSIAVAVVTGASSFGDLMRFRSRSTSDANERSTGPDPIPNQSSAEQSKQPSVSSDGASRWFDLVKGIGKGVVAIMVVLAPIGAQFTAVRFSKPEPLDCVYIATELVELAEAHPTAGPLVIGAIDDPDIERECGPIVQEVNSFTSTD